MEQTRNKLKLNEQRSIENDGVVKCLHLLNRTSLIHVKHEGIWRMIQKLFEQGFVASDPTGNKQISSKLLQQALMRLSSKTKFHDFIMHECSNSGRFKSVLDKENMETAVTAGLSTIMNEGGLNRCIANKGGLTMKMYLMGDAFIHIGTNFEDDRYPIKYRMCSLSDFYVDNSCTAIRDPVGGLSTTECCLIYRYSKEHFDMIYPKFKDKVRTGGIPRSLNYFKQQEKTWIQQFTVSEPFVEVAHYINISEKKFTVFGGGSLEVIEELNGKDFPFEMDGYGYIPVVQYMCFPSSEGFYNYGLGHTLYDLAVVTSRMDNMAYRHTNDNVDPINIVNVPNGQASSFFNKLLAAHQQRAIGGKGYAIQEFDINNPKARANIEPFQTAPVTQEWERAFMRLEKQIIRLGINLDEIDYGGNKTFRQIAIEQENQGAIVQQIMEGNASETEMLVRISMDMLKKSISKDDPTPINTKAEIKIDNTGRTARMGGITLGMISEELNENRYWVEVDSKSGIIPSGIMTQYKNKDSLTVAPPGSSAWNKILLKIFRANGHDMNIEDLQPPQSAAPSAPRGVPQEEETQTANAMSDAMQKYSTQPNQLPEFR